MPATPEVLALVREVTTADPTNHYAHRDVAQRLADAGYLAVVAETFTNCDTDPTTYAVRVFPAPATDTAGEYRDHLEALRDEGDGLVADVRVPVAADATHLNPPEVVEGPMGSTVSREVFRPGLTGGSVYGVSTAEELAEYAA